MKDDLLIEPQPADLMRFGSTEHNAHGHIVIFLKDGLDKTTIENIQKEEPCSVSYEAPL